ncbi:hypothetical protein Z945_3090 [Sulfitobacter noctilucae]|nr:hypothetical protein Z945_3090 [Sulfitobacter noctilucae]
MKRVKSPAVWRGFLFLAVRYGIYGQKEKELRIWFVLPIS